jgi:Fe-Mn family superoxide dismutase
MMVEVARRQAGPGAAAEEGLMALNRRQAVGALSLGAATWWMAAKSAAAAEEPGAAPGAAPVGRHLPVPLPFAPSGLRGLSERMIVSHHDNNYGAAVKNLNRVEEELERITQDTPAFLVSGMKERELTFTNSMVLHEHYFGNLGGDGRAGGAIQKALADLPGGFGRWEEMFRSTGSALAGGSGWVILEFDLQSGHLKTYWSGGHAQAPAFGVPMLVMDMYEHAYQMDYGAAAAKYIDAFFQNLRWEEVNRRYERALKAAKALRA